MWKILRTLWYNVRVTRETRNILAYAAPFATWIALQTVLPATALAYALRSLAALAAFIPFLRLGTPRPAGSRLPLQIAVGVAAGAAVCALWIAPEANAFYRTWLCWPFGSPPPAADAPSPYAPDVCGWGLTTAKIVGSAFVIAPAEELFFRSFLYRWLQRRDFLSVPLSRFDLQAFLWTVLLFTLEHDRPVVAAACGAAYGLLAIRLGIASAVAAHVTTNLLLAIYVVLRGEWAFW